MIRVTFEMYQQAKMMMVCAPAWQCQKEEACFHLAKNVIDAWEAKEHSAALTRSEAAASDVDHYVPQFSPSGWESPAPDWDAA